MGEFAYDSKVLKCLEEHLPDFAIEDVLGVFRVLVFVREVPRLKGESERDADPKTIADLRSRSKRILAAMRGAGLIEGME